jgi:protein-disulfide isomerase
VKRVLPFIAALAFSSAAVASEVDPKLDAAVREALPVCAGATVAFDKAPLTLPAGYSSAVVRTESPDHFCDSQYVAVFSPAGGFFLGIPWVLQRESGATVEVKLQNFMWRNLQENATATVERKRTAFGLMPMSVVQTTEFGGLPLEGELEPETQTFFFGHFRKPGESAAARQKVFEPFLASVPAKGAADATITVVEFSDFQCPSCKRAAGYGETIAAKYDGKVRYVRLDLPLSGHAWAFPAALAGRAIYRQKPDLFWEYKKQVYANQDSLNAFMFWDWARGFAEDHELDLAKYDADLASDAIRQEILRAVGAAFANDIRSTPSYLVNGKLVIAGEGGKTLDDYIAGLIAK